MNPYRKLAYVEYDPELDDDPVPKASYRPGMLAEKVVPKRRKIADMLLALVDEKAKGARHGHVDTRIAGDLFEVRAVHFWAQCPRCFEGDEYPAGDKVRMSCCATLVDTEYREYVLRFSVSRLERVWQSGPDNQITRRILPLILRWIDHKTARAPWIKPFTSPAPLKDGWGSCVSRMESCI